MKSRSLNALSEALRMAFSHVGPRQSQRMALGLLTLEQGRFFALMEAMQQARRRVLRCTACQDLTESPRCSICQNFERERSQLCIVENPQDVEALEASGSYQGLYHVLHGSLSASLDMERNPTLSLTIEALWSRLASDSGIREVILALDQDTAGELTSLYLARELGVRFPNLRVTRIGVGIPFGGEVLYADPATIKQSLLSRTEVKNPERARV